MQLNLAIKKQRLNDSGKQGLCQTPGNQLAGTNVKTPNRPKDDKKLMREAVQEVVDIQMETVTERVKELQISMNDLKEKMYDLNEDQWAFRKQQLWALKTQVKEQRDKASKAECVVGWPSDATASQRAFFLSWRIQSAGVEATSSTIKMIPKVARWDRIKGEPLKICMKAMDLAVKKSTLEVDMSKLKPWWGQNAIYDEYSTYA